MGGSEKRPRSLNDYDEDSKNQKRWITDRDEKGKDELIAYRILCPDGVIGSVIGKSGRVINSIRQDTRAKVMVVDPFPGSKDRVITIYCYVNEKEDIDFNEEFSNREPLCPAQDALVKMHIAIANAVATVDDFDKKRNDRAECQLLVPFSQSANIIGKSGITIKKLRSRTRANIEVNPKDAMDPTHSCAMVFDNFVQITGGLEAVKKALFAVSTIMYRCTPKEEIPLGTTIPEVPPTIIIPSDIPLYRSVDSILPSRSLPQGYADEGTKLLVYSSALHGDALRYELITRVLCPFSRIGHVIGKGGSCIKSVRQASGAWIEVDDTRADPDECIITITSTEALDDMKSIAVEAVLLLQGKINNEDEDIVSIRLLVPSKVIGCIIGINGSIVNEIRRRSKADVRVSKGKIPKCADPNDELIEVIGEVDCVRDALVQIVLRLRDDVLNYMERSRNPSIGDDSLYTGGTGHSMASALPNFNPVTPSGYEQGADAGGGLGRYGYGSLLMGDDDYGSLFSCSSKLYGGFAPPPSTLEMVVPAYAVGKVMGTVGANIDNIRKISGAAIEIVYDSKTSRGDRLALISGTSEQKRAAENLIQAFIMAT